MVSRARKVNTDEGWLGKAGFLEGKTSDLTQRTNKREDVWGRREDH